MAREARSYSSIVSAAGEEGLVHCILSDGTKQWHGDFTLRGFRLEILKREFAMRGVPVSDIEEFSALTIADHEEGESLAE